MANYDIGDALSRIENILLDSISRNMKRHISEESDLQKSWSMWQTEQLTSLGRWSAANYRQFAPQFTKINNTAMQMLQNANQHGELDEEIRILQSGIQQAQRFFDVPNAKLDSLLTAVRSDLSKAEHSILRKADDAYREALFDSHFYLESGSGSLNQAIDMAVADLHQRGLPSVTYRNGRRVEASVYARMALRTANERAQLLGEGRARDKSGIHTVIVPPSGIACPKCAPWLCRVLVDDVYSSGTPAEAETLKLPLLSEAIRQGFLHPNCNCSPQSYFPGQPVPELSPDERSEAVRKYHLTQKQRYYERQIRKWKRAEKSAPDKSATARKREWQKRCKDLCDANHDFLRRDYSREKIYDYQTPPITPNVIDKPTPPEPVPEITLNRPAVTGAPEVLNSLSPLDEMRKAFAEAENLLNPIDNPVESAIIESGESQFLPASSITEAEKYAKTILGIPNVSYRGVEVRTANEWNKGLYDSFRKFPELKESFGFVGTCQERNRILSPVIRQYFNDTWINNNPSLSYKKLKKYIDDDIVFHMKKIYIEEGTVAQCYFPKLQAFAFMQGVTITDRERETVIKALREDVKAQFHPVGCDTIRSQLDHEIGHMLDKLLGIRNIPEIKALYDIRTHEQLTRDLCRYAWDNKSTNNYAEMIAEAWAEYCNNPSPREIALIVGRTIEKEYEKMKGGLLL